MTAPRRIKTRREFIRGLGRTAALAALAGGGVLLARRSASGQCDRPTPCQSCKLLGRCDLPEARDALKRLDNE
ncbi:MAG: hypothetical protein QGH94_18085 [Phycisphaerae bacterium]|nr:hypothetical protein [Phycisphaerae bacterium]